MAFRPRLLPLVLLATTGLLGLKATEFWNDGGAEAIADAVGQFTPAPAAAAAAPAPDAAATPAAGPVGANPPAATAAAPSAAPPNAPAVDAAAAKPAPANTAAAGLPSAPAVAPAQSSTAARDPLLMSPSEIDVLQQLSERRAEIDKRQDDLRQREVLMQAAEKRIDEKISRLESIEQSIDGAGQKQDADDGERVKSLVRIYETMKPQEAARIFEQLDMPVLLSVLEHMREMKAAPVLAAMDPTKAKTVTLALAERRGKTEPGRTADAAAPAAPPAQTR